MSLAVRSITPQPWKVIRRRRRSWLARFWDPHSLFEIKATLLLVLLVVGGFING